MSRYGTALTDVFTAYGADPAAGLAAYANVDPEGWSAYVDSATEKQYRADYANWARSLVRSVDKERVAADAGQARLFEVAEGAHIVMRERLVLDGVEHVLAELTGDVGANVIRKVAERDLTPALTTVQRCRALLRLAEHMDAEAERLHRPVSAGEVLGWAA